jgi:hypothetical protein
MDINDKLLVEQAWALQIKLERRLEISRSYYCNGRVAYQTPTAEKAHLNLVYERACLRYIRRIKQLWS